MNTDDEPEEKPVSKVARLIEEYELGEEFGAQLESLWTSPGDDRLSLRDLADHFNKELLATALANEDISTVDGELANLYRLLTNDDVSSGARTEARARLEHGGIDIEALESDFVTYQAIRTYLTEYRGAEYDTTEDHDHVKSTVSTVQRLKSRIQSVVEGSLEGLLASGEITLGNFRVFISVDVLCQDCGNRYSTVELLRRGGCECDDTSTEHRK